MTRHVFAVKVHRLFRKLPNRTILFENNGMSEQMTLHYPARLFRIKLLRATDDSFRSFAGLEVIETKAYSLVKITFCLLS